MNENSANTGNGTLSNSSNHDKLLFWGCFVALVATAFGFIVRAMIIDDWGTEFGLDQTEKGELFGVGLWPFAISIILFSLIIDKIGYGRAMVFAFVCHVASAIITIFANGYWSLYIGTFIVALGNGTIEAVINPVVATMFSKQKTKWLNILHAGWPGGLVLGGLLTLGMDETGLIGKMAGGAIGWQWKVGLIFIPVVAYGLMLMRCKFPVQERVAAGVSYKVMLREAGILGCLIVVGLIVWEVTRVFADMGAIFVGWGDGAVLWTRIGISIGLTVPFAIYVRSLGRGLFIFLLLIMVPLATTELGTDSWITPVMGPEMQKLGLQAGWVLVYTSFIMMVLRFFAGPIVHRFSPLGLLAISAAVAAVGLIFLSKATGITILLAATLYGLGKTFFWPTMLGVVSERFPKGGALTLNTMGGVGMLSVGVIGAAFLGNIQDKAVDTELLKENPAIHAQVIGEEKTSVFGQYKPIDQEKLAGLDDADKEVIKTVQGEAMKSALMTVAIFPVIMLVCYLILIGYFRSKGGYKAIDLGTES